ncbi:gas vesicle protein GvpH [Haloplanus natans]|uniref:gas vesicle protein GvpH n=1 Tax=Haloplanus natans TaxID=376171 RepID=UPI000A0505FE|nr:gas vesicle protein GvpH [Haloplanus natans]
MPSNDARDSDHGKAGPSASGSLLQKLRTLLGELASLERSRSSRQRGTGEATYSGVNVDYQYDVSIGLRRETEADASTRSSAARDRRPVDPIDADDPGAVLEVQRTGNGYALTTDVPADIDEEPTVTIVPGRGQSRVVLHYGDVWSTSVMIDEPELSVERTRLNNGVFEARVRTADDSSPEETNDQ